MCRFPEFGKDKSVLVIALCLLFVMPLTALAVEKTKSVEGFKGKISREYKNSKEWWPTDPKPPKGAPNVIIFLLDKDPFPFEGGLEKVVITLTD